MRRSAGRACDETTGALVVRARQEAPGARPTRRVQTASLAIYGHAGHSFRFLDSSVSSAAAEAPHQKRAAIKRQRASGAFFHQFSRPLMSRSLSHNIFLESFSLGLGLGSARRKIGAIGGIDWSTPRNEKARQSSSGRYKANGVERSARQGAGGVQKAMFGPGRAAPERRIGERDARGGEIFSSGALPRPPRCPSPGVPAPSAAPRRFIRRPASDGGHTRPSPVG